MDNSFSTIPLPEEIVSPITNLFRMLFQKQTQDLITVLRQPTPVKITRVLTADTNGAIGGGLFTPQPVDLYQCPMSHEAWISRISVSSPSGTPRTPLTSGEVLITGSTAGEQIFFLPVAGTVAPVIITEGRLSASHLNNGEKMQLVADYLPAFASIRFDFQIILVSGVSPDTPLNQAYLPITD